jgi:hypothetical protein
MFSCRPLSAYGLGFCSTLLAAACTPPAQQGNCSDDADCTGRGQFCESVTHTCQESEADYTTTLDDGVSGNFDGKPIPFFRGQVCTVPDLAARAGAAIPMTFRPCLHPCITGGNNFFQHQWNCLSGLCTAMSIFYTEGSGANCPADAWGQFPKDMCNYDVMMSSGLGPVELDGNPVEGGLELEIPFLTNADLVRIVAYKGEDLGQQEAEASLDCQEHCAGKAGDEASICFENCFIKELAWQYLLQDDRVLQFDLRSSNPEPPASCEDTDQPNGLNPACECFDIGFG